MASGFAERNHYFFPGSPSFHSSASLPAKCLPILRRVNRNDSATQGGDDVKFRCLIQNLRSQVEQNAAMSNALAFLPMLVVQVRVWECHETLHIELSC